MFICTVSWLVPKLLIPIPAGAIPKFVWCNASPYEHSQHSQLLVVNVPVFGSWLVMVSPPKDAEKKEFTTTFWNWIPAKLCMSDIIHWSNPVLDGYHGSLPFLHGSTHHFLMISMVSQPQPPQPRRLVQAAPPPQRDLRGHGGHMGRCRGGADASDARLENLNIKLPYGYGSIPIDTFLVGWTSIYQLFWCSPGVQGFDTLPYHLSHVFFPDDGI